MDMSAEERDYRTIFVLQLARPTRPRDLEEFFSSVGSVRDVRIITDSRTGRSKGIGYVEFWEEESVALGLALNGQKLLGCPLVIQRTCAERNRAAAASSTVGTALGFGPTNNKGPVKLTVSNLHPNIDENMLKSIFEPFGRVENCKLNKDNTGTSLGNGSVIFTKSEDGHKAAEQLNGFELAGNNMMIKVVEEEDSKRALHDEERTGMVSGQAGRIQMMQKLASGAEMNVPELEVRDPSIPSIATQCFMLSNMFDPNKECEKGWDDDIRDDVLDECNRHGGALHIYVDKNSEQGNVYVKCPNVAVAHKSVSALHGRWFSGKVITANYVPVDSYHNLFPDAAHVRQCMQRSAPAVGHPQPPFGAAPMPGYTQPMMIQQPPQFSGGFYR